MPQPVRTRPAASAGVVFCLASSRQHGVVPCATSGSVRARDVTPSPEPVHRRTPGTASAQIRALAGKQQLLRATPPWIRAALVQQYRRHGVRQAAADQAHAAQCRFGLLLAAAGL